MFVIAFPAPSSVSAPKLVLQKGFLNVGYMHEWKTIVYLLNMRAYNVSHTVLSELNASANNR